MVARRPADLLHQGRSRKNSAPHRPYLLGWHGRETLLRRSRAGCRKIGKSGRNRAIRNFRAEKEKGPQRLAAAHFSQNCLLFNKPEYDLPESVQLSNLSLATLQPVRAAFRLRTSHAHHSAVVLFLFRKEVIQPQVLLRLPCYDFTPIMSHTLGACLLAVSVATSSTAHFRDVTGGVYKARERIHGVDLIRHY